MGSFTALRVHYYTANPCILGIDDPSNKISTSIASLDSDTLNDLDRQLDSELDSIIRLYSSYVSCIRQSLKANGVCAKDLCAELLTISAFNHTEQNRMLLSAHKAELEKAVDLNDVFSVLVTEYASFLNYDVFECILEKYQDIRAGQEVLNYPEYLNAYVMKHKISEFIRINPLLKDFNSASKEFVLKMDILSTSRLAKVINLKNTIAKILGVNSASLQILDIKEGCVLVTFLIPTPVAQLVFNECTLLSSEQEKQFQASHVLWLECNGCRFDFASNTNQSEIRPTELSDSLPASKEILVREVEGNSNPRFRLLRISPCGVCLVECASQSRKLSPSSLIGEDEGGGAMGGDKGEEEGETLSLATPIWDLKTNAIS